MLREEVEVQPQATQQVGVQRHGMRSGIVNVARAR